MILIRPLDDAFGDTETYRAWSEQKGVEDIDALIANMEKTLEGDENAPKPRAYEVIEVDVTRKVAIARKVEHVVSVAVNEEFLA